VSLERAYALLTLKHVDDEQRLIEGVASTPMPDRVGDIVEPSGAVFKAPLPLLWQHRSDEPIGQVRAVKIQKDGIHVQAHIPKGVTPRIDEAWSLIKAGLVKGLSIGFKALEYEPIQSKGASAFGANRFTKWLWLELSAVTVPANADATISLVKSLDTEARAALGQASVVPVPVPGVSGSSPRTVPVRRESSMKKSLADQIADWQLSLKDKNDRIDQLIEKSSEAGVTFDDAQQQEHDTLADERDRIRKQIKVLEAQEAEQKLMAAPVAAPAPISPLLTNRVQVVEKRLPPGIPFARFVMCKAAAVLAARSGDFVPALEIAKQRYPDDSLLRGVFEKAAVGGGTAGVTAHWAADLVPYNVLATDFVEYLRPRTIIGQFGTAAGNNAAGVNIPSLHNVPFNVRIGGFSAGLTGYWVGEGLPIPVSKATSTAVTLTWAKIAGLCVLTEELIRFSTPSAEARVRDDIARAVAARMDTDFVDPAKAATANVSPASITNGVVATPPTGTTAAKFRADLATMLNAMVLITGRTVLIMSDTMATTLSMMVNTLGNSEFPQLTPTGGTINGIPVVVSEFLTSVGSPGTQTIVALKPDEILLADDGTATVDASNEASIEMSDAPLQSAVAGTGSSVNGMVNMWQTNSVAIRAVRMVSWAPRRTGAVQYIAPAAYVVQ